MIRDFSNNDLNDLINLLHEDTIINTKEVLSDITESNNKIYVYDSEIIKGFVIITPPISPANLAWIKLYVGKPFRHDRIGTKLHEEAFKWAVNKTKSSIIATKFASLKDDPTPFFRNLNYQKWFIHQEMRYHGGLQPEPNLNFVNYEDKYFEKYVTLQGEAFYNLRKAIDIPPYNCSDFSNSSREYYLKNKNHIYLLLDHEDEIISTIYIKDGFLDKIMVNKNYEGQGYGCKTTHFGINKALKEGCKTIELCTPNWNNRAISIYEALGFEVVQTFHNYRQFIK